MASGLRPRSNVNYKALHEGESLPLVRVSQKAKPVLLEDTYFVDRIVSRKETDKKSSYQYLVIWKDYPAWDATWEPENHLSPEILETFVPTEITSDRLRTFTESFERAVQSRLKCRNPAFSLFLESDLFRYVFGDVNKKLCEKDDFSKLNLPSNWFYVLDKDGTGRKIKFPMKVSLKLYFRKIYVKINGKLVEKNKPFERLNCFSASESCTLDNL